VITISSLSWAGSAAPENGEGCEPASSAPLWNTKSTQMDRAKVGIESKRRANIAAHLALRGFALHVTDAGTYIVARWNLARELRSLDAVDDFARRLGAQ